MARPAIFFLLIAIFCGYSLVVYTRATESEHIPPTQEQARISKGKQLYQQYNCQACHQVYGLGGYLGPDLTRAWSDPARGEAMMKALLKSGGNRMPDFKLSASEIDALLSYLKYIDATTTAATTKN